MDSQEELEKIVRKIIAPLGIETFLRLKGFKPVDKSLCNSAAVWENKDEKLAIVFYEME